LAGALLPPDPEETDRLKREALLRAAGECGGDLDAFLRRMALEPYTDPAFARAEGVRFLTFHAAKGLEFPVVFLAGGEVGITPLSREGSDPAEEKRLFYVALTRAREEVHFTSCLARTRYGKTVAPAPSRFLAELPSARLESAAAARPKKGEQLSLL
jgi:DNA helicase II / ATP-dependent DNA helicase PcrA